MARNVEIKARVVDKAKLIARAKELSGSNPIELKQDDTFFNCPKGRLKLREFSHNQGELIFYQRADVSGPKTSHYSISPTFEPGTLRVLLAEAYGAIGRVIKKRLVFMVKNTRIHIDEVVGLGAFVELEVVLDQDDTIEEGEATARELMDQLEITPDLLLDKAYLDLLGPQHTSTGGT